MLIDTHVHIQHPRYATEVQAVLSRAAAAGISGVIVPGTTVGDSIAGLDLARGTSAGAPCTAWAALGIHPTEAYLLDSTALGTLRSACASDRVVAIGEIGLDYYWPRIADRTWPCADPETQRTAFEKQLELASEMRLPVIIHDRDAHRDTLETVRAWKARDPTARGTFHSYAAGADMLEAFLALGLYIGIDGPVTFSQATDLHKVARQTPMDRLLLETDGPFLAPIPYRGKRNEPAYLIHIAARVAELRGLSLQDVEAATTRNAKTLFALDPGIAISPGPGCTTTVV